jgi:hypothetical protein
MKCRRPNVARSEVTAPTGNSRQLLFRGETIEHFMRNVEKV